MNTWNYHPSRDIGTPIAKRLRDFPREPGMLAYAVRSLAALLLRAWLRGYHRLRIEGRENLPATGSYVLVCNHTSHLDTLCLLSAVALRKIHHCFPAAAADYFFTSLPRSAISAVLINALPFDREAGGARSLAACAELLRQDGNILILFPEGTRTTTGAIGRFRSGIGRRPRHTALPPRGRPAGMAQGQAVAATGAAAPAHRPTVQLPPPRHEPRVRNRGL
jgi:1-acyl-sn-glycerol-3-phosphate acyltransferase